LPAQGGAAGEVHAASARNRQSWKCRPAWRAASILKLLEQAEVMEKT